MIWVNYVLLAGILIGDDSESAKRSGVSRAYYGAFNLARRWLEAHDISIDNHRAHDRVWRAFKTAENAPPESRANWQAVGTLGGALRGFRNQVDYADVVPGLDKQAIYAVDSAERIVALLDELEFS